MAMAARQHGHLARYLAVAVTSVLTIFTLTPLAAGDTLGQFCGNSGNYTANSNYQANIQRLASTLPRNTSSSPTLFAKSQAGTIPEATYALALCRGDVNASACRDCVATAFQDAQQLCAYNMDATVFYDLCLLRYSNQNFITSSSATSDGRGDALILMNTQNVTAPFKVFDAAVGVLLDATADYAAANSSKRFGTAVEEFRTFDSQNPRIYGLAQCTPDMAPADCRSCLAGIIQSRLKYFSGKQGGRILGLRCNYRYEQYAFFTGSPLLQLPEPPMGAPPPASNVTPPATGGGKKQIVAGILGAIAGSVVLMSILSLFLFLRFRRRSKATVDDHPLKKKMGNAQCTFFNLSTLQEATENFSEKNKLGEGGFGTVYNGILSDGHEIAVKTLLGRTGHALDQLHNEVLVLAQLQHKNLVRLLGFCSHQDDTLLVYEYIKNGSLDSFLFDNSKGNALHWEQQYNIILGIAKGILYLHEDSSTRIIHRDLKSNNILLDDDMEPKIADFGLARLLGEGHTRTQTAKVVGTFGYMAPEYVMHGRVSPKIDIFSFGVLVLEIVMRRSNCSSDDQSVVNLLSEVWDSWTKWSITQMLDQSLDGYGRSQALRCIHVGLMCVQVDPDDRPDISAAMFMLTRDGMELQLPEEPAFFFARGSPSASRLDVQSCYTYDRSRIILEQDVSVNELTYTEPYPR